MNDEVMSPEQTRHAFEEFWFRNNIAFLLRYWHTATESLERVTSDPDTFAEFQGEANPRYVEAVVTNHLEHHNYSGVLLAYAAFEEFMDTLTTNLGRERGASIQLKGLRERGVKRYKKYLRQVCTEAEYGSIDWDFLEDFGVVRNAIIHGNGNKGRLSKPKELELVVDRRGGLSFKHRVRLVVSKQFVIACIDTVRNTALAIHRLAEPSAI